MSLRGARDGDEGGVGADHLNRNVEAEAEVALPGLNTQNFSRGCDILAEVPHREGDVPRVLVGDQNIKGIKPDPGKDDDYYLTYSSLLT